MELPEVKQVVYGAGGVIALDINGKLWIYKSVDEKEGWVPLSTEVISVV